MDLYEYQGKRLFSTYDIPVPAGTVVELGQEAPEMPAGAVVKTQVLTGGRGKAGGIAVCGDDSEVQDAINRLFGSDIKGHRVKKLLVEQKVHIEKELYFSIFLNRKNKCVSLMFSDCGGMNIEGVDKSKIKVVDINPLIGIRGYVVNQLLSPFDLDNKKDVADVINKAYRLFKDKKLQLLEINPLAVTGGGKVIALDAKVTMDDWYIDSSVDLDQHEGGSMTEFEREMLKNEVVAVEMQGDIAIYANGAGVSMATADCIIARGGTIRAIVDEGSLTAARDDLELRKHAAGVMKLLLPLKPKVIFMNMFFQAGMLDLEALTIKMAFEDVCGGLPVIVRFKGRNAEEAVKILEGTNMFVTQSFEEACQKAIECV